MTYGLEQFCDDCCAAVKAGADDASRETIRRKLEKLLGNEAFVAAHCGPDAERGIHTLFHDAETDLHVLAHIYERGAKSPPHDHGPSWAVYGQARLHTDMIVWRRTDDGSVEGRAELEVAREYRLEPGMAGTFNPGDVHSIEFPDGARFVRVTGTDLNRVGQHMFDPDRKSVRISSPMAHAR